MREKLESLFAELQNSQSPDEIFSRVHIILSSMSPQSLSEIISSNVDPKDVVRFILSQLRETSEDGMLCLQKIMHCFGPTEVMALDDTLVLGLNHASEEVRELFLKELKRCADDNRSLMTFLQNLPLLKMVAKLISDDNASVAKHSANLLTTLCCQYELGPAFLSSLKSSFEELLNGEKTVQFRLYQMTVSIASTSPASLQAVADIYLQRLITESQLSQDILVQLNSIELLRELAVLPHGITFLEQRGVLQNFERILQQAISDPLTSFLLPGLLRFFGSIGIANPNKIAAVLPLLLSVTRTSADTCLQGIAIETVGAVGSSVVGKMLLHVHSSEMEDCMQIIGRIITSGETEQRVRAIDALVRLLTIQENSNSNKVDSLIQKWYYSLGKDPTIVFVALCKQPFKEMKLGAFDVLSRLASTEWGQKEIVSQPGFLEYLLDRSTEHEKEGKEKKYIIVREIVRSPIATTIFSTDVLAKMDNYVKEGPFYVQAEAAVGFESFE